MSDNQVSWKVNHVLGTYWGEKPLPVDPFEIARAIGIGFLVKFGAVPQYDHASRTIAFNPSEPYVRQRFGVAHALAHVVLNHAPCPSDTACSFMTSTARTDEIEANQFALELLVPKSAVKYFLIDQGMTDINEIAEVFNVSHMSIRVRLIELGYLSK